jgi:hypothetical protein
VPAPTAIHVGPLSEDKVCMTILFQHCASEIRRIVFVVVLLVAPNAFADEAYDQVVEASEALEKAVKVDTELREAYRYSSDSGIGRLKRTQEILDSLTENDAVLKKARSDYDLAIANWQHKNRRYLEIIELAKKVHGDIRKTPSAGLHPVNRQRALKAIELDIQKLGPKGASEFHRIGNEVRQLLTAGKPLAQIKQRLDRLAGDDPASKRVVEETLNLLEGEIMDLPAASRWKAFNKVAGNISKATKIISFFGPSTDDPFQSGELEKLTNLLDIGSDFGGDKLNWYLQIQLLFLEEMQKGIGLLKYQEMKNNLILIDEASRVAPHEQGEVWRGMDVSVLFGIPGPNPLIEPVKTVFEPGEPITGKWYGSRRYDSSAWIGLLPASVTHGPEAVGDANDIEYASLEGKDSGRFSFSGDLDPGRYDLRMYDDDGGGKQVFSVTIEIKETESGFYLTVADVFGKTGWRSIAAPGLKVAVTDGEGKTVAKTVTGKTLDPVFVALGPGNYTLTIDIGSYIPLYESACANPYERKFTIAPSSQLKFTAAVKSVKVADNGTTTSSPAKDCIALAEK